jgi:hypothetical protein
MDGVTSKMAKDFLIAAAIFMPVVVGGLGASCYFVCKYTNQCTDISQSENSPSVRPLPFLPPSTFAH